MEFYVYGIDYKHKVNEFSTRTVSQSYFMSYFRDDYCIELSGRLVKGRAGDFIVQRPGDIIYHGPKENSAQGFANDWLYFGGDEVEALLARYPIPVGKPFRLGSSVYLSSAINKIHAEKSFLKDGYREKCDIVFTDMLIDIYRAYKTHGTSSVEEKLEYVRGAMIADFSRSWNLSELAGMAGYSVSRFCSLYKAEYGVSAMDDLMNIRIDRAKLLMHYGGMSLASVAEAVGFSSIYYFSRQFKKKEGITPSNFKKNL